MIERFRSLLSYGDDFIKVDESWCIQLERTEANTIKSFVIDTEDGVNLFD